MSQIESTLKARDVEETLDIYFYRPLGYGAAVICRALRLTPNAVTILSIFIGMYAGHLFYYRDTMTNIWGIVLWIVADVLDSADGQLARMTNHKSKLGRILDGFATNLIFMSMYGHLYARMLNMGYSPWWCLFIIFSGASHSMQSALADYYRNAYLRYVIDPNKSELHRSEDVIAEYNAVRFADAPMKKILMFFYRNYTVQQEAAARNFLRLRGALERKYGNAIPQWFRDEYRRQNKPLMKYYAILTTNTRMIAMSIVVLLDQPFWYFLVEGVVINVVMVVLTIYQESLSANLFMRVEQEGIAA